jgi:hypothetical protein
VPEQVIAEWKQTADVTGVSVAELIRQTMSNRLHGNAPRNWIDPFEAITDLVGSREVDLTSRVDEVLYGGESLSTPAVI